MGCSRAHRRGHVGGTTNLVLGSTPAGMLGLPRPGSNREERGVSFGGRPCVGVAEAGCSAARWGVALSGAAAWARRCWGGQARLLAWTGGFGVASGGQA